MCLSNLLLRPGLPITVRSGCPGPYPDKFWMSPKMEIPQLSPISALTCSHSGFPTTTSQYPIIFLAATHIHYLLSFSCAALKSLTPSSILHVSKWKTTTTYYALAPNQLCDLHCIFSNLATSLKLGGRGCKTEQSRCGLTSAEIKELITALSLLVTV